MRYSYNLDTKSIIFASAHDLNASFKDLCAVCDSVRYMPVTSALKVLDGVINENRPIEFRRHNKYMGSRHELHGRKGRYPIKCAKMVRAVIVNASANATSKGEDPDYMYVVHASANKTYKVPRAPPKGVRAVSTGGYGYTTLRKSNLEFAKVEIGIAEKETESLGAKMKRAINAVSKKQKVVVQQAKQEKKVKKAAPKPPAAPQSETAADSNGRKTETKVSQQQKVEEPTKV